MLALIKDQRQAVNVYLPLTTYLNPILGKENWKNHSCVSLVIKNIIIRTISCRDTSKGEDSGTNPSKCKKGKGMFLYSAVSRQLDRSKRFTLHRLFIPAPTQLLWEAFLPITRKEYSLTLPALSIARYSFIQ